MAEALSMVQGGREDRPAARVRGRARMRDAIHILPHPPLERIKTRISIEDLLIWAYRDQMVHVARREDELVGSRVRAVPRGYGSALAPLEAVESSPRVFFSASEDAFAVHAKVRSLSKVKVALPADCVGKVDERVAVRTAVPNVAGLITVDRAQLVMGAALDGRRPDWVAAPAIKIERGQLIYDRDRRGRVRYDAAGRPRIVLQLVRFIGDMPWEVARARVIYAIWVAALDQLRSMLAGALERHEVTELTPEAKPWVR